jgi:hypothetical protein
MNLSRNFTLEEAIQSSTAARNAIDNTPDGGTVETMKEAAANLEKVRKLLGVYIVVLSWFRCPRLNKAVGSSETSAHVKGWAIDFTAPKFGSAKAVAEAIKASSLVFDQLIYEGTWVHISFDPRARMQVMTAVFAPGKKTTYKAGIV